LPNNGAADRRRGSIQASGITGTSGWTDRRLRGDDKRFTRWAKAGFWERVFDNLKADRKNE
jgi:hypothetical protein